MASIQRFLQLRRVVRPCQAQATLLLSLLTGSAALADTVQLTLKNGDTINCELILEESSEEVKVLMHPQLGRLEVNQDAIKPSKKRPKLTSTISAGVNAGNQDGDGTFSANINGTSNYKNNSDQLKIEAGLNYGKNKDKGKSPEVNTDQGMASIRYDRSLTEELTIYAKSGYQYNGLNDSGTNIFEGSVGIGLPLINNTSTQVTLSVGPKVHWSNGGNDCNSNKFCGNAYGGGNLIADLSWSPYKSFQFKLENSLSAIAASEVKPTNTFTATLKYFPRFTSGLFTSLRYASIYNSMSTPESDNRITGQVGYEF